MVGRSEEWVKAVEAGRLHMPRLPMLIRLAEALGIDDLAVLTGDQSIRIPPRLAYGEHPSVPAIRDVVQRYSLTRPDQPPQPVAAPQARVDAAWRTWHASPTRRSDVGEVLPAFVDRLSKRRRRTRRRGPPGGARRARRHLSPDSTRHCQRRRAGAAVAGRRAWHGCGTGR